MLPFRMFADHYSRLPLQSALPCLLACFSLTPFFTTHPKDPPLNPFLATLPKSLDLKSFVCHTSAKMGGVPPLRTSLGYLFALSPLFSTLRLRREGKNDARIAHFFATSPLFATHPHLMGRDGVVWFLQPEILHIPAHYPLSVSVPARSFVFGVESSGGLLWIGGGRR
jgi:hypothetical protein